MRFFKGLVLTTILSLCSIAGFAAKNDNTLPDITGTYQCKGYDPGGNSNYANPITITKNGDIYNFQWLNSNGVPFNLGTGIFNSKLDNAISVVFWDPKKADFFGTMIYEITSDGSLQGNWVIQGTTKIGTESCTKNK